MPALYDTSLIEELKQKGKLLYSVDKGTEMNIWVFIVKETV